MRLDKKLAQMSAAEAGIAYFVPKKNRSMACRLLRKVPRQKSWTRGCTGTCWCRRVGSRGLLRMSLPRGCGRP